MSPRQLANSLLFRLILFGLLMIVLGSVGRYFVLSDFLRQDLTQVVSMQQESLARYVARDVDEKLVARRFWLERLAETLPPSLLQRPDQLRAWLAERHGLQPLFSLGLVVTDSSGRVITDFPVLPGRVGASFADVPDFHGAAAGATVIGRPMQGPVSRQPILAMGTPIRDTTTAVRGVLIGITALGAPGFLELLQQTRIGQGGGFLLVSPRDRLFIAATDPAMVLKATPAEGVNPLHDRAMAGFRGSGITVNANGVEEISGIASVTSTGWFVVARIPTTEALSTVDRLRAFVMQNGVLLILFMLVVGPLIIWLMLRPLFRAAAQADRMTLGELPLAPLPVVRDDEVGHLTAAFNRLLAKLRQSQEELDHQAHHDSLTGLPNRLLLADRLHQALARAQRNGTRLAVLYMDLDGFKPINDRLGHDAGDEALRQVARRLQDAVRSADTLARVGGDEFVVLAVDLDAQAVERMETLARKCLEVMAEPLRVAGQACQVGLSIGIVIGGGDRSADQLLVAADAAMYRAKEAGRGRFVLASGGGT